MQTLKTNSIKTQGLSFFDLDHTLLVANSAFRFGVYLYQQGFLSFHTMVRLTFAYIKHKAGLLSLIDLHKNTFDLFFKGKPSQPVYLLAEKFVERHFEGMLNQIAVRRLQQDRSLGHAIVLLSSSPDFLVKLFAQKFSIEIWRSTRYTIDCEGRFCSVEQVFQGENKAQSVAEIAKQLGVPIWSTVAYSDSHLDIPFLEAAGKAIGVNPDRKLRTWCNRRKCQII